MSNQLPQGNQSEKQNKDEVDRFVNSTGDFARLPQRDGESSVFQFFKDKSKRELAIRTFEDPITHEKIETTKVKYKVLIPDAAEQGEKSLETPKMLAQQIEANINKNHCLLEITRHGTGPNTRYTVIAA
jgi:hypothetical protein